MDRTVGNVLHAGGFVVLNEQHDQKKIDSYLIAMYYISFKMYFCIIIIEKISPMLASVGVRFKRQICYDYK